MRPRPPTPAQPIRSIPPPSGFHAYTEKSIVAGSRLHLRVSSNAAHTIQIHRLGHDANTGLLDPLVADLGTKDALVQPLRPGSYVHVGKTLPPTRAINALTLEAWVRPLGEFGVTTSWRGILTQHTYPDRCGIGLFLTSEGRLASYLGDGATFRAASLTISTHQLTIGEWHYVAVAWTSGAAPVLYMRRFGQAMTPPYIGAAIGLASVYPGSAPMRIGAYGESDTTSYFLDGDIAAPGIYETTSIDFASRSTASYPSAPAPGASPVRAFWSFQNDEGSASVTDISGNGRTGAIVNVGTWMIGGPGFQPNDPARIPRWGGSYDAIADTQRGRGLRLLSDDLFDCGWSETAYWDVPAHAKSGVYVARIQPVGGGSRYDCVFVVRPPARRAQTLVLCATNTWLAYNRPFLPSDQEPISAGAAALPPLPDYSIYVPHARGTASVPAYQVGREVPWPAANPLWRYYPASDYGHLLRAERFVHVWLERKNVDFDVATDAELDGVADLLAGYACVVINGHSEYWSRRMYEAVQSYLAAGGKVLALTGNSLFWRVSLRANGTMECRKYDDGGGFTTANKVPDGAVGLTYHADDFQRGGLMRECGLPGHALLGLEASGFINDAPEPPFEAFSVQRTPPITGVLPALYQSPRSVERGATLSEIGLIPGAGAAGHEWDCQVGDLVSGVATPPGATAPLVPTGTLTRLASATRSRDQIHYWGRFRGASGDSSQRVVSEIIHWQRGGGGEVVYAGSIAAGWGVARDPRFSQLAWNALYGFGVLPRPVRVALVIGANESLIVQATNAHGEIAVADAIAGPSWSWLPGLVVGANASAATGNIRTLLAVAIDGDLQAWYRDIGAGGWLPTGTAGANGDGQSLGSGAAGVGLRGDPCVAQGRLDASFDVLALGQDGTCQTLAWTGAAWTGWSSLAGGFIDSPAAVSWVTTTNTAALTAFGVGPDGQLYTRFRVAGWSPSWQSMGCGELAGAADLLAGPVAGARFVPGTGSQKVHIFATSLAGRLWTRIGDEVGWTPWQAFAEPAPGVRLDYAPAVVAWPQGGGMTLAAVGTDGRFWTTSWNGVQWAAWTALPDLPIPGLGLAGPVAGGARSGFRLDFVATTVGGGYWLRSWNGSQWLAWVDLGSP